MADISKLWDVNLEVDGDESVPLGRARAAVFEPMLVCVAVSRYKRRLGVAPGDALREDKLRGRRVGYALYRVVQHLEPELDWCDVPALIEDEQRVEAAALQWAVWLPKLRAVILQETTWCATWLFRVNLRCVVVRSIVYSLQNAGRVIDGVVANL